MKIINSFIKNLINYKKSLLNLKRVSGSSIIFDNFGLLFPEPLDKTASEKKLSTLVALAGIIKTWLANFEMSGIDVL